MKRKLTAIILTALFMVSLVGCEKNEAVESGSLNNKETVELLLWGAEEDKELLEEMIYSFKREYQGEADFNITFAVQGESGCKDALLDNLEEGADVFTFADDQLSALAAAGALEPVEDAEAVKQYNIPAAAEAAIVRNTVYAYPLTSDNGYFLYYNKRYFSEEDVAKLDSILETAASEGKLFSMDWSSAWYVYSFFGNTGMEIGLNDDGITNYCTWNRKEGDIKGIDVARAMMNIAKSPAFSNRNDTEFLEGVQDGTVIAGVSGVWNAVAIQQVWGDYTGATKLPTYTCGDSQIQMASFSGCKLVGVNSYSKYYEWACKLAEWITNEKNQKLRFSMRGQGPSNIKAASSIEVQQSPAISALLEQSEFSQLQRIGGKFWDPVAAFAGNIASENVAEEDLQKQLDKMVEGVTAR